MNLKPLKTLKGCTTSWLTNQESGIHIISRHEALLAAPFKIYTKIYDPKTKGVRDILLTPKNILVVLLLAKVLSPINFCKQKIQFLQY